MGTSAVKPPVTFGVRFMECWRQRPHLNTEAMPAMSAALWLICGILAPGLVALQLTTATAAVTATAVLAIALWFGLSSSARRFAWLLPIGTAWIALHLWAPWQTLGNLLPAAEMGITVEGITLDTTRAATASAAVPAPPGGIPFAIRLLRETGGTWVPCRETVLLRLPKEAALPAYGTRLQATGALLVPQGPSFPGEFDYRAVLRSRGIRHQLQATDVASVGPATGWRRAFAAMLLARDAILRRATRQLTPDAATFVSGVLFGGNNLLDRASRDQFANSGTIHIFSVSGLHVAILAALLNGILRLSRIPFRWRHAFLPALLLPYVLMTGADPAAIRAWTMISVWAIARASLRPSQPLNTLALAALAVLASNPLNLFRTGFQFSFTLVFFLIIGWPVIRAARQALLADEWLRPGHGRANALWNPRALYAPAILLGATLAAAAAFAPTAWINQRFIPGSVFTNIGIGLCASLAMTLSGVKLLLSPLTDLGFSPLDGGLAKILNSCATFATLLADAGSAAPASIGIPRPPFLLALFYSLALAAMLTWRGRARRVAACATGASAILILTAALTHTRRPRLLLLTGDGASTPAMLWQPAAHRPPLAIIPGNLRLSRSLKEWLTDDGVTELDLLVQTGSLPPDLAQSFASQCELRGRFSAARSRAVPGVTTLTAGEDGERIYGPWRVKRYIRGTHVKWCIETRVFQAAASLEIDSDTASGHCRLTLSELGQAPQHREFTRTLQLTWHAIP